MLQRAPVVVAAAGLALAATGAHAGTVYQFSLSDHPNGNQAPPGYGLRFDNLFAGSGGNGGVTTFSFSHFGDTVLTVTDNTSTGGDIEININGTLYGGEKTGGFGLGAYALDFTYSIDVQERSSGWRVKPGTNATNGSGQNFGSLTALSGTPFESGTSSVFNFSDKANNRGVTFKFLQDGHRLSNAERNLLNDPFVGRGWVMGGGIGGTHDFLFLAQPIRVIPLPHAAGMGVIGLGVLASRRRR